MEDSNKVIGKIIKPVSEELHLRQDKLEKTVVKVAEDMQQVKREG